MSNQNLTQQNYQDFLKKTATCIQSLPPCELSYYLILLICTIEQEDKPEKYLPLLAKILDLSLSLQKLFTARSKHKIQAQIEELSEQIDILTKTAIPNSFLIKTKQLFAAIIGCCMAVITGILGAIAGIPIGIFAHSNHMHGAISGLQIGLVLGTALGYTFPQKLATTRSHEKLTFCLSSLKLVGEELKVGFNRQFQPSNSQWSQDDFNFYQNETKAYIIDNFFSDENDKEAAFQSFLNSEQSYQVCTTPSGLIDRKFDGSLGHHSLIRYKINGIEGIPMEFGNRKSSPRWVDQAEPPRQVTGQKLFEMLVFDRQLAETHPKNLKYVFKKYKTGSRDCLTYVNVILLATNQAPTSVKRFQPQIDSGFGTKIMGPVANYISATSEHDLEYIPNSFSLGKAPDVLFFKRPAPGKKQQIEGWSNLSETILTAI